VAVVGIFILSGSATDLSMRSLPGRAMRDLRALMTSPAALVAVLLLVAFAASAVAFFPRQPDEGTGEAMTTAAAAPQALDASQQAAFETYYKQQPRVPLPVANDGAKVVIVKFNDYMCPPCKQTYLEYKPILARWQSAKPGLVKLVMKDYPLDPACNPNTPQGQHLGACEAAVAVRLARERGRADEMEAWLYQNQGTLSRATARQGAREIGHVTNFEERFPAVVELVKGDIALGTQLRVTGTPTFYINGVKLPGLRPEFFNAAIEYELQQAGVK
jgi:protein-disulfide isomerase